MMTYNLSLPGNATSRLPFTPSWRVRSSCLGNYRLQTVHLETAVINHGERHQHPQPTQITDRDIHVSLKCS